MIRMTEWRRFRIIPLVLIAVCLVLALVAFLWGRSSGALDPSTRVQIGTATEGGTYWKIGLALRPVLKEGLDGPQINVQRTAGSIDNIERLERNNLDLALIQSDVTKSDHVRIVAPLYHEYLHIIVRTDRIPDATSIKDLRGKRVALGPPRSGSRVAVEKVLEHFNVAVEEVEIDSVALERDALIDGDIDAICRVAGLPDPIVTALLMEEGIALMPVDRDEESLKGFRKRNPNYAEANIPKGTYGPPENRSPKAATISVTALLVARSNLSPYLVRRITEVFYEKQVDLRTDNKEILNCFCEDLKPDNVDENPYLFEYHPGARAYHKGAIDWNRGIPLMAAVFLLVSGVAIALCEGGPYSELGPLVG